MGILYPEYHEDAQRRLDLYSMRLANNSDRQMSSQKYQPYRPGSTTPDSRSRRSVRSDVSLPRPLKLANNSVHSQASRERPRRKDSATSEFDDRSSRRSRRSTQDLGPIKYDPHSRYSLSPERSPSPSKRRSTPYNFDGRALARVQRSRSKTVGSIPLDNGLKPAKLSTSSRTTETVRKPIVRRESDHVTGTIMPQSTPWTEPEQMVDKEWPPLFSEQEHRRPSYPVYQPPVWAQEQDREYQPNQQYYETMSNYTPRYAPTEGSSVWDEIEFYKYGRIPNEKQEPSRKHFFLDWREWRDSREWNRKRKLTVFGIIFTALLLLILIPVAAEVASHHHAGKQDFSPEHPTSVPQPPQTTQQPKLPKVSGVPSQPQGPHVTNAAAFKSGGANQYGSSNSNDGIGKGKDEYTYYTGGASNFPDPSKWVSFDDMWDAHFDTLQNACTWLGLDENNTPQDIAYIYAAIQDRADASLVDHRFIFAIILQESNGCVHVGQTTSSGGVTNPGLMQSNNGHSYNAAHSERSIFWMVRDGTQGTQSGNGLVQYLNQYGNPYEAARGYNSGHIAKDGNLSAAAGATACYVSDIANRLTGWVKAKSTCPGDTA